MAENYSTTYGSVVAALGKPAAEQPFQKRDTKQVIARWPCGCEFHETEAGSGVLFACEQHSTDA
jgi:hypothetical protein